MSKMISVFIDENLFFGTSKNDFIRDLTMNNSEQENNPNLYKIFNTIDLIGKINEY